MLTPRRVSSVPWYRQQPPTLPWAVHPRPEACAYCGEEPPVLLCGPEHGAYVGEWLCQECYAALFAGPVLVFAHHHGQDA